MISSDRRRNSRNCRPGSMEANQHVHRVQSTSWGTLDGDGYALQSKNVLRHHRAGTTSSGASGWHYLQQLRKKWGTFIYV
ncbi:hypothetical protein TNCV_1599791 [Trichonephila clavipes]|nr:hypothetical protein TNCV_1599791 [Trichonephila clavipes]